jgi:aminoglycoside phosphotransferase (APT) family kinase protein
MQTPFQERHQPAVDRALLSAFGTTTLDSATPLSGGLSGAGLWRIRVGGIPYVLKIEESRHAVIDPARAYACMRVAAAAFLAPRVRYAEPADGIAIMEHVAPVSLAEYGGPGLIVELAQAARLLHQTPAFPPQTDYLEGVSGLIDQFRALDVLDPAATDELFALWARFRAGYRTRPEDRVSSHNDLNPGNVVYDGSRLWLVDWDAAFLADRYVDLATLANWFTRDAAGEAALLSTYFGRAPDLEEQARFELMRLVNHVFAGARIPSRAAARRALP